MGQLVESVTSAGIWRITTAVVRHRRRLWLASAAIALSVGYLAGALTLLDRVSQGLEDLSAAGVEKADLVIEGDVAYESALEQTRRLISTSVAMSLVGEPGLASVIPRVEDIAVILDPKGNSLVAPGLTEQPIGSNWPEDAQMTPYEFVGKGRPPKGADEVVIDHQSAEGANISVGDKVSIVARNGVGSFTVVGIVTTSRGVLPSGSSLALFDTERARSMFDMEDTDTRVAIRVEDGADINTVRENISASLPYGTVIVTGAEAAAHRQESINRSFTLVRSLIMGFAGLALVVGVVTAANSLTLLYAERKTTFAAFRLIGAKRYQLLIAALAEAVMLAVVASLAGVPIGLLLGALIEAVLGALGTAVPVGGSFLSISALTSAVVVGSLATVAAAALPAWRACSTPPIEAIVPTEAAPPSTLRKRANRSLTATAGAFLITWAMLVIAEAGGGNKVVIAIGVAAAVLLLSLIPTALAKAVATGIMWFPERSGTVKLIGARDALRNQTRTAATTGALLLATAVVSGIAVFLSSFSAALDGNVSRLITADLVVDSGTFTVGGLPRGLLDEVATVPGVASVSGWQLGRVYLGDIPARITGMDGDSLESVISPGWVGAPPGRLGYNGIALYEPTAKELGVSVGDVVPVLFTSEATEMMTVEGIFTKGDVLLGSAVINRSLLTTQIPKSIDIAGLVTTRGDSKAVRKAVTEVAKSFGVKSVLGPDDFVDSRSQLLRGFERVIQWMLLFTLIQALVGVVNTLLMSVGERRREFGLLRAAGASRQQILKVVMIEGSSFAVVGTALGLVVGIIGAWGGMRAISGFGLSGFVVPIPLVLLTGMTGVGLGVLAAIVPARWAAAVPPLEAVVDSSGTHGDLTLRDLTRRFSDLVDRVREWDRGPSTSPVPPRASTTQTVGTASAKTAASGLPTSGVATGGVATSGVATARSGGDISTLPPPYVRPTPASGSRSGSPRLPSGADRPTSGPWLKPSAQSGGPFRAGAFDQGADAGAEQRRVHEGAEGGKGREHADSHSTGHQSVFSTSDQHSGYSRSADEVVVPQRLLEATSKLDPLSVIDGGPLLSLLDSTLEGDESVLHLVQGWVKGLPCLVAGTPSRLIVLVSRYPEPLVQSLDPTGTGVSTYGPPNAASLSMAIIDGKRMLEVNGVRDRAEAVALTRKVDSSKTGPKRSGYF